MFWCHDGASSPVTEPAGSKNALGDGELSVQAEAGSEGWGWSGRRPSSGPCQSRGLVPQVVFEAVGVDEMGVRRGLSMGNGKRFHDVLYFHFTFYVKRMISIVLQVPWC